MACERDSDADALWQCPVAWQVEAAMKKLKKIKGKLSGLLALHIYIYIYIYFQKKSHGIGELYGL